MVGLGKEKSYIS